MTGVDDGRTETDDTAAFVAENPSDPERTDVRVSRQKLVAVLLALACLTFSAVALKVNEPRDFRYVDGTRGEVVSVDQGQVTVGDVHVGTQLLRGGRVVGETEGMFVAVTVTLAATGNEKVNLNVSQLVTQQRIYQAWSGGGLVADAGFAQTLDLVYEVDPAEIDDLSLQIWSAGLVNGYHDRGRVHLGITADNAEQWRAAGRDRSIEPDDRGRVEALP